ncbi:MAG: T9SS type A sorting domain-containing protein [Bacteroidia bacterium]|nr:T9SS type A sorting domain-containing protein [Bacteroidia bacterium]
MRYLYLLIFACLLFNFSNSVFSQNALDLDGIDDFVQTNYQGILGNNARTVEAWIKTSANANPNNGGVQQIIADWGNAVTSGRFTFNVLFNDAIRLEVQGNGVNGTIAVTDGNWHHVAAVYDPNATLKVSLYVDGMLDIAGNLTVPVNTQASVNLQIGKRVDGARFFDGLIDEVRVWNVARTQNQIIASKNNELCPIPAGLVAYYRFNQGVAGGNNAGQTTLTDLSGNNYHGTLMNFALNGSSSNWVQGANLTPSGTLTQMAVTACDSFLWPTDSTTYFSDGVYTSNLTGTNGCDSVVELTLTLNHASSSTDTVEACGSYSWAAAGQAYYTSGDYTTTLPNANQCDSLLSLHLTIHPITSHFDTVVACNSYFWPTTGTTYSTSGTYTVLLTSSHGCDSLLEIDLTIETVDTSVMGGGTQMAANQAGATYQWLDCDNGYAPVAGATGQDFFPGFSSHYAVEVTLGSCKDTSGCHYGFIVGVEDEIAFPQLSVYPNPTSGQLNVVLGEMQNQLEASIFNPLGQEMLRETVTNKDHFALNPVLPSGLYFLQLRNEEGKIRRVRVVVE